MFLLFFRANIINFIVTLLEILVIQYNDNVLTNETIYYFIQLIIILIFLLLIINKSITKFKYYKILLIIIIFIIIFYILYVFKKITKCSLFQSI